MPDKKLKIILDTNIWISFLISDSLKGIDKLIKEDKMVLIFSIELIEEFIEVAERPKFKKIFSNQDIRNLLRLFDNYGVIFNVKSKVNICRDVKDNFLLSLAKDSKADFLVTNDSDLLILNRIDKTIIISLADYLKAQLH